jgi:uncharacterized damage-inducible protein DinB
MTTDEAREQFAYGSWATGLVFAAAEALPAEQLAATVASSFPSVGSTLAHLVGAEWLWLRRWLGESPTGEPAWIAKPDLSEMKAQLALVESERSAFLATLSDADLGRVVSYRTRTGSLFADPLGSLIRHVVNHSTYHRGQIATQLRQLGQKPPNTDLLTFLRPWK